MFQVQRNVKNLFKMFLSEVEDLKNQCDDSDEKLKKSLPNESYLIDIANVFDDNRMKSIRKKILDSGNDCLRSIEEAGENCGLITKEKG